MIGDPIDRERRQQTAALVLLVADVVIAGLLICVATLTHALSIFSAVAWIIILLALRAYVVLIAFAADRGLLRGFEFGTGKIQQTVRAILGVGLVVGGIWVIERIVGLGLGSYEAPRPIGYALAAFANSVALLVGLLAYSTANQFTSIGGAGDLRSFMKVHRTALNGAIVVQIALTLAVVVGDSVIAIMVDALGAAIVAVSALWHGVGALRIALPDLIDAPPPHAGRGIRAAADAVLPPGELAGLRTRRCGGAVEVEITIVGKSCRSAADLARWHGEVVRQLATGDAGTHVALVLATDGPSVPAATIDLQRFSSRPMASNISDLEDTG